VLDGMRWAALRAAGGGVPNHVVIGDRGSV